MNVFHGNSKWQVGWLCLLVHSAQEQIWIIHGRDRKGWGRGAGQTYQQWAEKLSRMTLEHPFCRWLYTSSFLMTLATRHLNRVSIVLLWLLFHGRLDPSLLIGTIHCVKCYSGTKGENGSVLCIIVPKETGRTFVWLSTWDFQSPMISFVSNLARASKVTGTTRFVYRFSCDVFSTFLGHQLHCWAWATSCMHFGNHDRP